MTRLSQSLGQDETKIAGLLGVTSKTLNSWKVFKWSALKGKSLRLKRLYHVVGVIENLRPDYSAEEIYSCLCNGRFFVSDPEGLEPDDTCSLMGYICAAPEAADWLEVTRDCIKDFEIGRKNESQSK